MDLVHPFDWLPELVLVVRTFSVKDGVAQRAILRQVCRAWRELDKNFSWFRDHPDLAGLDIARPAFDELIEILELKAGRNLDLPVPSKIKTHITYLKVRGKERYGVVLLFREETTFSSYRFMDRNTGSMQMHGPSDIRLLQRCKSNIWNERVMMATGRLRILPNGGRLITGLHIVI